MAALLWSSQWPVGSPSKYFSLIKASWIARQRWSSMSFCPRFFHEPCRLDFTRCTFPLLAVLEICAEGLVLGWVLVSARHTEAIRQKNAAKATSKRPEFLIAATANPHLTCSERAQIPAWRRASFHVWMLDATQVFT